MRELRGVVIVIGLCHSIVGCFQYVFVATRDSHRCGSGHCAECADCADEVIAHITVITTPPR